MNLIRTHIPFILIFLLYSLIGAQGYGNDNDTYLMIRCGTNLVLDGLYVPSRPPGYLIPEIIIGGLSLIGGQYLTNLASAILGTMSLYLFWRLLITSFSRHDTLLICLIVGLNPHFIIAASSSMDYVYSLFFGLTGIVLLTMRKPFLASIPIALASCSRLGNILLLGIIYLYFIYTAYQRRRSDDLSSLILSAGLWVGLTFMLFIPSFIAYNNTFGFITYYIPDFTFAGHLTRFIYKNIYLFGPMAFVLIWALTAKRIAKKRSFQPLPPVAAFGLAMVIVHEILYFKIPLDIAYLLPLLLVIIPLWMYFAHPGKIAIYGLLAVTISYGFIANYDILNRKYNAEGTVAIAADIGLYKKPGLVVDDILRREASKERYSEEYRLFVKRNLDAKE